MIDSHCHLDDRQFEKDRKTVVEEAKKAGVRLVINPASDFSSNARLFKIAGDYRGYILPCAGIDPISCLNEAYRLPELNSYFEKCTAVGEIGLDYYWSKEKERQITNFKRIIDIALDHGKPIIVHAREAMTDTLDVLEQKRVERAVLHCFSGTAKEMKRAEELGYYISFATNICYRDSKSLIKDACLSNMIIETDSPYLNPARTGRNEPKNVRLALEKIAEIVGKRIEDIEKLTEKNTKKAFGL
jgi:TatD DNase family protein